MIRINLLPFRAARKQENVKRQVTVFGLTFVLFFVLLLGVHFFLGGKVSSLEEEKEKTENDLKLVQKQAEEVQKMQAHLKMVKKRLDVIDTLKAKRSYPVKLLDHETQWTVADRMWLTSLSSDKEKLVMTGVAVDENTVSAFHKRLENSGQFTVVSLDQMQKTDAYPGMSFQEFSITCYKPAPVEEENKDGAKPPAEAGKEAGK